MNIISKQYKTRSLYNKLFTIVIYDRKGKLQFAAYLTNHNLRSKLRVS